MPDVKDIGSLIGGYLSEKEIAEVKKVVSGAEKYKNVIFDGAKFPDDPYRIIKVKLNSTVSGEYIPLINKALAEQPKGLIYLCTAMTHMEGFKKGSRSYRTNNPGNIGNTDSGANKVIPTLSDGILLQANYMRRIADRGSDRYPLGKPMVIKPFFSKEIADNPQYGLPPYLPGYRFTYTGQLDQFIKIYSTGARATNIYLNTIVSYFAQNGVQISPESTLQEVISIP